MYMFTVVKTSWQQFKMVATIIFFILLATSFIPVFRPFGQKRNTEKNGGQLALISTYTIYLTIYLLFWYLVFFESLYLGYELGDVVYYLLFGLAMMFSNLGLGLRNKISNDAKYVLATVNIFEIIFLVTKLLQSNLMD